MGTKLTGDLLRAAMRKLGDIQRQLGQDEYPHDAEKLLAALQAVNEGRFEAVGGGLSIVDFKFMPFLKDGESYVVGDTMVERANGFEGREPGEIEGRWLLENQKLIPVEYRGKYLVITGWRRPGRPRRVACL